MAGTGFEFLSRDHQLSVKTVMTLFSLSIQKSSALVQVYSRGSLILETRFIFQGIIHTEIANKMQQCIKIYYAMLIWSSTCFGRHTAHHQKLKTALASSGFAYVKGFWTLSLLDAVSVQQTQRPTTFHVWNPEAASAVLSSWWRAVCRPKYVELHINME
jgi:hypothetical protein